MKRYLKLICIVMIFVILFNVIVAEKVNAISVTAALGGIVFASLLVSAGIKVLNKHSIDKLYSKWLEVKPDSIDWSNFVMTAVTTSYMTGKFAFDKASDVVKNIVKFVKQNVNVSAGEATVNLETGSYYTNKLSIKDVVFSKDKGKNLIFYIGRYKLVFRKWSPNSRLRGYGLFVGDNVSASSNLGFISVSYDDYDLDRADALYITHLDIVEYYDDITGDVDYIEFNLGFKVRLKYSTGYEWTNYVLKENERIESQYLGIPSVVNPDNLVNLYVDENSVISGSEIKDNIVNPILPLTLEKGIDTGIYTRKGNTLIYEGDLEDLLVDLDVYYDDVLDWYVNKDYADVNSLPNVAISEGEGVLTLPYVDVGDIGDIQDPSVPSVPSIPDDMFEPGEKSIDWSPLLNIDFSNKFPFCLPYDFKRGLEALVAPPQVPSWTIPIMENEITIDFSQFEELARISRFFFTLMYIYVLILVTKRIMGGQ